MKWNRGIFVLAALSAMASGLWPVQKIGGRRRQKRPRSSRVKCSTWQRTACRSTAAWSLPDRKRKKPETGMVSSRLICFRAGIKSDTVIAQRTDERYVVSSQPSRIKIVEKGREKLNVSQSSDDKEGSWPAVLLVLHGAKPGEIVDASVLDPERVYEFSETPVYWLGEAGTDESLAFVERTFEARKDSHLQETLLFLASCHPGTAAYDFLKKAAVGSHAEKCPEKRDFLAWELR